jgi:predicted  nucleic acid-binding Zn-ribbon protein
VAKIRDQSKPTAEVWYHSEDLPHAAGSLRARLKELEAQLTRLQSLQLDLQKEREQLKQAIWAIEVLVGDRESAAAADGKPVWQHIQKLFLSNDNTPMSIPEIVAGLEAKGIKLDAKNSGESARAILIRKPDIFKRLEGGKFRIK